MSIIKNTLWNVLGAILPAVAAIILTPLSIKYIGESRFGVYALLLLCVTYFNLFDFGVSKSVTYYLVQSNIANNIILSGLVVCIVGSIFSLGVVNFIFPYLIDWLISDLSLRVELRGAILLMSILAPVIVFSSIVNSILEAKNKFFLLNIVFIISSTIVQIIPVVVGKFFGGDLYWLVGGLLMSRFIMLFLLTLVLFDTIKLNSVLFSPSVITIKLLLRYGIRIWISMLVSPIMDSLDKILIGRLVGLNYVSYYSVPFSLVEKMRMLPSALARSSFVLISSFTGDEAAQKVGLTLKKLSFIMFFVCIIIIICAKKLLNIWIGVDFSQKSSHILIVLVLGGFANSLAIMPYNLIQARGSPGLVAKIHLMEIVPFIAALVFFINKFGALGAAYVWTGRVTLDLIFLLLCARIEFIFQKLIYAMYLVLVFVAFFCW